MKPGLSLRVSQHLALTPQLQQSIRLLQLSTLELSQEIEQMMQDNPFLEQEPVELGYEESLALARDERSDEVLAQEGREDAFDDIQTQANEDRFLPAEYSPAAQAAPTHEEPGAAAEVSTEPNDWEGDASETIAADDPEWGVEASARGPNHETSDNEWDAHRKDATAPSLQEHLHRQALSLRLSEEDRAAIYVLIESLNDDGYLEDGFEELAQSLGATSLEEVEDVVARLSCALKWLQNFEPIGVGARDLAECLRIQLRLLPDSDAVLAARAIVGQPLAWLARRDVRRLALQCHLPLEAIKQGMALVARLEPKPARAFAQVERNIVIPDVIVRAQTRRGQTVFAAHINPEVMPKLHINDLYANALKSDKKSGATAGLQTRLQEARWFIKNVQQRFDTILRVSQAIIDRQASFFRHGAVGMRPLVLREIADEIGMHESTISRVTTAKYMSTPFGTYELKYFFGSGLATETGGNASSTAVRELIKQFIDAEDKAKPLSDNALADMLSEQGIACARRTVAKYREALRIPVASLRKSL